MRKCCPIYKTKSSHKNQFLPMIFVCRGGMEKRASGVGVSNIFWHIMTDNNPISCEDADVA